MLMLVGLGLEVKDISVRALEALQRADTILAEQYTTILPNGYLAYLEKTAGKKITHIKRSDMEENVRQTLEGAKSNNVAILVPGDPLVATTHHIVVDTARKMWISIEIYHSSSVFSAAIGESGLDVYKFGPTTTIPFQSEKYRPTSFLDVIKKNTDNGEHTLVLLDIDVMNGRHMNAAEAVGLLLKAEAEKGYGVVTTNTKVIVLEDIGRKGQKVSYTIASDIKMGNATATALIIPAKLNFAEEDALKAATSSST